MMNKYTLGTIIGAAILGLTKSKSGGRNDEQKKRTFLKLQKVLPAILKAYPFKDSLSIVFYTDSCGNEP